MSASMLTAGLFIWPLYIVKAAGQNAGLILMMALAWGITIALSVPGKSGHPKVTLMLDGVALAGVWLLDGLLLNQLGGMLQMFYYFNTPRWALMAPLLCTVWWAVNRSASTAWRLSQFWVPILLVVSFGLFALASLNVHHPRVLFPNQVIAIFPLIHGLRAMAYMGLPLGLTLRRIGARLAEPPSAKWRVLAVGLPWVFLVALYAVAMGSLGPDGIIASRWPVVMTMENVTLDSTFFLSRVGIVVVFTWTLGVTLGLIIHLRIGLMLKPLTLHWRQGLTAAAVVLWGGIALAITSPQTSSRFLVKGFDPLAGYYLVMELAVLWALRALFYFRSRPRLDTAQ